MPYNEFDTPRCGGGDRLTRSRQGIPRFAKKMSSSSLPSSKERLKDKSALTKPTQPLLEQGQVRRDRLPELVMTQQTYLESESEDLAGHQLEPSTEQSFSRLDTPEPATNEQNRHTQIVKYKVTLRQWESPQNIEVS